MSAKRKKKKNKVAPGIVIAIVLILLIAVAVMFVMTKTGHGEPVDRFFALFGMSNPFAEGTHENDPGKETEPKETEPKETEPKETEPKETEPKETEPKETEHHHETESAEPVYSDGEVTIHFLELGNKYTGDCTYIKAGDVDILIDAGSRENSAPVIGDYLRQYVTDGKLEYVIATHAHQDHIAGFAKKDGSIFDQFECENVITFSLTNATSQIYEKFQNELSDEVAAGATWYKAGDLRTSGNYVFDLGDGMTLTILDQEFYYETTSDENDYSVCCLLTQGAHHYLFTGDLEKDGEKSLVEKNDLPKVDLFKGAHHGSYTASTTTLLDVIDPDIVCVCCCAGATEYTSTPANTFPSQAFCDRVAPHTDCVYVTTLCVDYKGGVFTSMNGNIVVTGTKDGITVHGSHNDTKLKDTDWFKENRECPEAWK